MRLFANLSIRHKLMAISMLTTVIVIVLMGAAVVFNEAVEQKRSVYQKRTEQLATLAEIIGSRSTAALIFDDQSTARENLNALNALRADSSLVFAAIYRYEAELFAEYQSNLASGELREQAMSYGCETNPDSKMEDWLPVCRAVFLDGERLGDVRIVFNMSADLAQFRADLMRYLTLVLVLLLLAFGLAVVLSSRLQRLVSAPILVLREAMERVSRNKDYSVRVVRTSNDELGTLIDGFNDMLVQIQSRDVELARYSSQLEDAVTARTAELAEANRRRILWLENLARFLRHELKNTTVGVRSSLDLIERRAQGDNIVRYVDRARSSVSFMQTLLESVGNATTLEASFHKDPKVRLDLVALVTEHIENCRPLYPDTTLITDCEDTMEIHGNAMHMVQLLDKLVGNAVDHSRAETPIVISLRKSDGNAQLTVADEGEPLPDDKERIFELFVSMRDARHSDSDNLGLGLYIVKLIAESHGGTVKAEELTDRTGAAFRVTLPLP